MTDSSPAEEGAGPSPFIEFLYSLVDEVSYRGVNEGFQFLVKSAVLHDKRVPLPSIPKTRMRQRLKAAVARILPNIAHILDSVGSGESIEALTPENRAICLLEIIRYGYRKEIIQACVLPDAFWKEKKRELLQCAAKHGVKLDSVAWAEYLRAVDAKSKKMLAREKAGRPEKEKKTGPLGKRRTLFKEYVNVGAAIRLDDAEQLKEYAITAHALLAIGSRQLDPGDHLQLENEIVSTLALLRAAMIMPKAMLEDFAKKMDASSERLINSVGSIIVHRPEDADRAEVDNAVQEFLKKNQPEFSARIEKWKLSPDAEK